MESIGNGESEDDHGLNFSELEEMRRKVQEITVSMQDEEDPLERHIGSLSIEIPEWGERHDELLGEALAEELRRRDK